MNIPRTTASAALASVALCWSCGPSAVEIPLPEELPDVTPKISIAPAPLAQDTIEAQWVISVALSGVVSTGQRIRLSAPGAQPYPHEQLAYFCPDGFDTCHGDSRIRDMDLEIGPTGGASVGMVFGREVGSGWIKAGLIGFESVRDSVQLVVDAGNPAQLVATPEDTTLYVGRSFTLRTVLADRLGNAISAADATLSSLDPSLTTTGSDVLAASIGRGRVEAATAEFVDTISITVPPEGTLAAYRSGPGAIVQIELDGSGHRALAQVSAPYYGIWPVWGPDDQVLYEAGDYGVERMYVVDTTGVSTRVTHTNTPTKAEVFGASASGAIYFSATGGAEDYGTAIWRVSNAGEMPTRIGPNPPNLADNWQASPSPDGQRLAYYNVDEGLSVLDIMTGVTTSIRENGQVPQWSPVEDMIAFVDASAWLHLGQPHELRLIQSNGTGERVVADGHQFIGRATWSPDGEWLVARDEEGLRLVRVDDGLILPIPWGGDLTSPTWR